MNLVFDKKLFPYLFLGFIALTILGTICHELGHYLSATYHGFKAAIHFNSTSIEDEPPVTFIISALFGSCAGFYLWFFLLGPIILP